MFVRMASLLHFFLFSFLFFFALSSHAGMTYVQKTTNSADPTGTTLNTTVTSTTAGSLIVVFVSWEGANGSTVSVSDGTTSFTSKSVYDACSNDCHVQLFYLLSSNGGKTTISTTWSSTRPYRTVFVWEYTLSSGSASFDVMSSNYLFASSAITSGNMTTTGTDETVFAVYKEYAPCTLTSPRINGVAPDQSIVGTGSPAYASTWAKYFSSTFTGAATGTISSACSWIVQAAGFKVVASTKVKRRVITN